MDKEIKEQLKQILSLTDDKLLLKFAKSYASKDEAFAKALIETFMPCDNTLDYKKMVDNCFLHRKKGRARRYGSSLDWVVIRRDIKHFLKQLEHLRKHHEGATAAENALLLLEVLADKFESDHVYEDYNYQNSNFGNEQALAIVSDVIVNDKDVPHAQKLDMVERLRQLATASTYKSYLSNSIDNAIDTASSHLLAPEDLLNEIDNRILSATYSSDKTKYVKWKINLLYEMGRDKDAEAVIKQNLDLEDISIMRYEQLMDDHLYDKAIALCKKKITNVPGGWKARYWYEKLLEIGRRMDDKKIISEAARWLFFHVTEKQEDYYHTFHECFSEDEWPANRDKLFSESKGKVDAGTLFKFFEEERLFQLMYQHLLTLPTASSSAYYGYQNSGGERLALFSRYARYFSEKQQKEIVDDSVKVIRSNAKFASERQFYAQIAEGIYLLSKSCEWGGQQARTLVAQILRDNPMKSALKEELGKYDYWHGSLL